MTNILSALRNPPVIDEVAKNSPLEGLVRRQLRGVDAVAQSVAALGPTAAVATLPSLAASGAGPGTAAAVFLATVLVMMIAYLIGEFARRLAVAGSLYSFAAQSLKPFPAFLTGISMLMGYASVCMFAVTGAAIYTVRVAALGAPGLDQSVFPVMIGVAGVGILCFVLLRRGIRVSSRVTLTLECCSVVVVLALIIVLLWQYGPPPIEIIIPFGASPGQVATGTVVALMAFVGFESATVLGAETRQPLKKIPRALFWTVFLAGLFYLLATYTQLMGFTRLGIPLSDSNQPLGDLAVVGNAVWLAVVLDVGIALSFIACALASTTALVRVMFTMGREGVLPEPWGRAHPRFKTPYRAVQVALPIVVVGPLVLLHLGLAPWGMMMIFITCAAMGHTVAYIALCIAAPLFLHKIGELTLRPLIVAGTATLLLAAALLIFIATSLQGRQALGVAAFAIAAVVASGWYVYKRQIDPGMGNRLGLYDQPIQEDLLGPAPGSLR